MSAIPVRFNQAAEWNRSEGRSDGRGWKIGGDDETRTRDLCRDS